MAVAPSSYGAMVTRRFAPPSVRGELRDLLLRDDGGQVVHEAGGAVAGSAARRPAQIVGDGQHSAHRALWRARRVAG